MCRDSQEGMLSREFPQQLRRAVGAALCAAFGRCPAIAYVSHLDHCQQGKACRNHLHPRSPLDHNIQFFARGTAHATVDQSLTATIGWIGRDGGQPVHGECVPTGALSA